MTEARHTLQVHFKTAGTTLHARGITDVTVTVDDALYDRLLAEADAAGVPFLDYVARWFAATVETAKANNSDQQS